MILIRADANEQIGAGHVMRCVSIAHALHEIGEETLFITADHKADDMIRNAGFEAECLDSDWAHPEKEDVAGVITKHYPNLILVDSYFISGEYFQLLNSFTRTAYLDDLNAGCWDVDVLINYNVFAETFDYSGYHNRQTKLLVGPAYTPLRKEFLSLPPHEIRRTVTDILVSAGGADPEGITVQILRGLCPKWKNIRFHFVIGALNPRLEEIQKLAGENVVLRIQENRMANLMGECDMAISAAGTTLYELCAIGLPTITFTMADNQIPAAVEFERQKVMVNTGDCRGNEHFLSDLEEKLKMLIPEKNRKYMSQRMQQLLDGCGAEKIAAVLTSY